MSSTPRVLVAGLRGGSGKTLVSLGLAASWCHQGMSVAPFKKGPDYIDAAWLSRAAKKPCRNLDLFLMPRRAVTRSFVEAADGNDIAVIEGNRGLFDGVDALGSYSTAELAKLLVAPVVLVVDCTKSTRTVAALVLGCQRLDPQVAIDGVILNRVGSARHESVVRDAIERSTGVPVLGAIGKLQQQLFPERHLGLVPPEEHAELDGAVELARSVAEQSLDLDCISELAGRARVLNTPESSQGVYPACKASVKIGVFRDAAFQFYYPENLEALTRAGAEMVAVSPLTDAAVPQVDALYIGGGFPETMAPVLSRNRAFLDSLRDSVEKGLPVYAECGGAVFLGEKLIYQGETYAMSRVLPIVYGFERQPKGHGYVELETVSTNRYYDVGTAVRGHEFHHTYMQSWGTGTLEFAFRVRRGFGFDGERDGVVYRNVLACYTHVHALGTLDWAPSLVRAATWHAARKLSDTAGVVAAGSKMGR